MPRQQPGISRVTPGAKTTTTSRESEESGAEHPLMTAIMSRIAAEEEETPPITSSPSVDDTTTDGTLTGAETPDILLTLPKEKWLEWVTLRLALFQDKVVEYAQACKTNREHTRSASEAEWQAIIETDGITRAIPNEQEIYKWVLSQLKSET